MYDKQVVRRRRAALAVLVALSIGLLTVYFGEGPTGLLHGLQRGAQTVLQPIETGVSRATKPFRDLFGWVGDNLDAKSENDKLKKENADLRKQVTSAQLAQHDNEQLRKQLGLPKFAQYPKGTDELSARVIASSPTFWFSTVQIDKGIADGVRVNQAVVSPDGLIGRITSVTSSGSTVTLITDSDSNVSAMVLPSGARGVVSPDVGNPENMEIAFLKSKKVHDGDTVVTAGSTSQRFESYFPRGIPIGKLKHVALDEIEATGKVRLQPFADFRQLEWVRVLRAKPRPVDTEQAPNGIAGAGAPTP
jgi:rod shape-determining protein MreC